MIAEWLTTTFGTAVAVAPYLLLGTFVSMASILVVTNRTNEPPRHPMSGR